MNYAEDPFTAQEESSPESSHNSFLTSPAGLATGAGALAALAGGGAYLGSARAAPTRKYVKENYLDPLASKVHEYTDPVRNFFSGARQAPIVRPVVNALAEGPNLIVDGATAVANGAKNIAGKLSDNGAYVDTIRKTKAYPILRQGSAQATKHAINAGITEPIKGLKTDEIYEALGVLADRATRKPLSLRTGGTSLGEKDTTKILEAAKGLDPTELTMLTNFAGILGKGKPLKDKDLEASDVVDMYKKIFKLNDK